jgi:Transglutaminase-like superfamily
MKILLSLLIAAVFFFAAASEGRAQVYGLSVISWDDNTDVYGYSLTEILDGETAYYYDAGVEGIMFDGDTGAELSYGFALNYHFAEVNTYTPGYGDKLYGLVSYHYLGAYFYVEVPPVLSFYDPGGWSYLAAIEYPGNYQWFAPGIPVYREYRLFLLGMTLVGITPPLRATIAEVGFTGDHLIQKYPSDEFIGGSDGSAPVWVRNGKNDPVAYNMNSYLNMFGIIRFTSRQAPGTAAKIRVRRGGESDEKSVTLSGNTLRVDNLRAPVGIGSNPPNHGVKIEQYDYMWEISVNNGASWSSLGTSGPHKVYYTFATPIPNPFDNFSGSVFAPIYDRALQYACTKSGNSVPEDDIVFNITNGIASDLVYDPGRSSADEHPLEFLANGRAVCIDNVSLLRGLLRTVGIPAATRYVWGGTDTNRILFKRTSTGVHDASMRVDEPNSQDGVAAHPHFVYHALCLTRITPPLLPKYWDPSYGVERGTFNITEFGTLGRKIESASRWTPPDVPSTFTCPH